MTRIHLASGLAIDGDSVLLVASSYPSHPQPLWNIPGGRQLQGELLRETVLREVYEETGLSARIVRFAYISESYDGDTHFLNAVFEIGVSGTIRTPQHGDHVVGCEWCPIADLPQRLEVAVVREPLLAYLSERAQYFAYHDAGITIRWP